MGKLFVVVGERYLSHYRSRTPDTGTDVKPLQADTDVTGAEAARASPCDFRFWDIATLSPQRRALWDLRAGDLVHFCASSMIRKRCAAHTLTGFGAALA